MASTNNKVRKDIPDDLALNILSKLPVKSLKRFRCVRKSWSDLLENPRFISMYLENLVSKNHGDDDSCLLVQQVPSPLESKDSLESNLFLLSGNRYENKVKLDWPTPFQENAKGIYMLGSCVNGTICLRQGAGYDLTLVLWNPTTEEFKVIPSGHAHVPGIRFGITPCGFGCSYETGDYNIIQLVCCFVNPEEYVEELDILSRSYWQIYSLKRNCWKKLDLKMPEFVGLGVGNTMYLNGVCHWLAEEEENIRSPEIEDLIVSFDMSNESFHTTLIDRRSRYEFVERTLIAFNGLVGIITKVNKNNCFELSILDEIGVKESWVKLFTIGTLPSVEYSFGVGNKGDIFFSISDDELAWFDSSTHTIEEIDINGARGLCQTTIYKESLVPLG